MAKNWELDRPKMCPFCGAEGKGTLIELTQDLKGTTFWVYCKFCGSRGPISTDVETCCDKWNRRIK